MKESPSKSFATTIALALSPAGYVYLDDSGNSAEEAMPHDIAEKIQLYFASGSIVGLLRLGLVDFLMVLPASFKFWQRFAQLFITEVCKMPELSGRAIPLPVREELLGLIGQAPCMTGIEYLNVEILTKLWHDLESALRQEIKHYSGDLESYFKTYNAKWNLVGRVYFHLAENKESLQDPFAFLATYTTGLSTSAKAQHLPLGRALQEYSGEKNNAALLSLLLPVQKAATQSKFIKSLVDSGEIFHPLAWRANDAHSFLKDIPLCESAGVVVRVPNWWSVKKPPRPQISVAIGTNKASALGMNALLDFDMEFALASGEKLTSSEWKRILASTENLIKIKGQWIEVDRDRLQHVLDHWKKVQHQVKNHGLTFAEGLRLLAGNSAHSLDSEGDVGIEATQWSRVVAGSWLKEVLNTLRSPGGVDGSLLSLLKKHLKASLRPYQLSGVKWLWLLYSLKLGGCLADDMGLGKTIQILSLLLLIKHDHTHPKNHPHLLVIPASLLGNWQAEITRFTPELKILIVHSSMNDSNLNAINLTMLKNVDLVITTYTYIHRYLWLSDVEWDVLILDEAQMIKNPGTKQTRSVKALKSHVRFTLTGTPIENRLSDLWSLFDFTSPGLLGSSRAFTDYHKKLNKDTVKDSSRFYSAIRGLVGPYILRRLKSDKRIIVDLPDKTEVQAFCTLTKPQVCLYQQAVAELTQQLKQADGIKRRGIVLSFLLRFKQICNHPAQWLGHGEYGDEASGKFLRLKELCQEIAAKQEKVLVFTQFREIIPFLATYLASIFGREGLILHGSTSIKQRPKLVEAFQSEQGPPFFVLSLKAGGTGLNLTNASHVIHFDRWWNPAVENQATDRAYRIGQKKNVLVHKFICRGTIEEKIDALISSKKMLSNEILAAGSEVLLTELNNDELLNIVSLDIHRALSEE